eukprot:2472524-Lingulodinium_polyedra.AAC.1
MQIGRASEHEQGRLLQLDLPEAVVLDRGLPHPVPRALWDEAVDRVRVRIERHLPLFFTTSSKPLHVLEPAPHLRLVADAPDRRP